MAELTCALCGGPADQAGRFCSHCVGEHRRASASRWSPGAGVAPSRLRLLSSLRWPVVALLFAGVGLGGARAAESWSATRRLGRIVGHGPVSIHDSRITSLVHLERSLSLVQVATTLAIGAVFLLWWGLAYQNLSGLGIDRRNRAGWAVLSWFLPPVSLVAPKRLAEELRVASDAETPLGWSYRRGEMSGLVTAWWTCWVVAVALPPLALLAISETSLHRPADLGAVALGAGVSFLCSGLLLAVAGLCAVVLVGEVTTGQIDRAWALAEAGLLGPSPLAAGASAAGPDAGIGAGAGVRRSA
jgi:hypothetical protein